MPPNFLINCPPTGETLARQSRRRQLSRLPSNKSGFSLVLVVRIFALAFNFSQSVCDWGLLFVSGCAALRSTTYQISIPTTTTFGSSDSPRYRQRRSVRSTTKAFGFYRDRAALLASVPPVLSSSDNNKNNDFRVGRSFPPLPLDAVLPRQTGIMVFRQCRQSQTGDIAAISSISEGCRPKSDSDDIPVKYGTPSSASIKPWNWVSSAMTHSFDVDSATATWNHPFSIRHEILPTYRSFPSFMFWRSRKPRNTGNRISSSLSCSSRNVTVAPVCPTSVSSTAASNVHTTSIVASTDSSEVEEIPPKSTPSSVHLQLVNPSLSPQPDQRSEDDKTSSNSVSVDEMDAASNDNTARKSSATTTVIVHTYHDASANQTWKGLNISLRKFRAYLQYCNVWSNETSMQPSAFSANRGVCSSEPATELHIETVKHVILSSSSKKAISCSITTTEKDKLSAASAETSRTNDEETLELRTETTRLRDEWRSYWKVGRLITDRTELLAVYPSDKQQQSNNEKNLNATASKSTEETNALVNVPTSTRKRGGFADLLFLYTDRLLAILNDEREDDRIPEAVSSMEHIVVSSNCNTTENMASHPTVDLVEWLETNYGKQETRDLLFESFQAFDEKTKLVKLKHFLEWFRSQFPYFYDRCDACGASIKEDSTTVATTVSSEATNDEEGASAADSAIEKEDAVADEASEANESEHQTFVGYIYPSDSELIGKASRTELYQCHKCFSFTRFPRYNTAKHILSHRRGRCGEYSMILFRFLRALNHECRWVVDWADHVWAELLLLPSGTSSTEVSRWVHLDPCEAAVDENFIYQDWGKKQNFIIGFYLPSVRRMRDALTTMLTESNTSIILNATIPLIEDITSSYTREPWEDVCQRRDESESHIQSSVLKATHELHRKLLECYNFTSLTKEQVLR
jgi:Transglutaminase-like superfamily